MLPELRNSKQDQARTYRNVQKMVSISVSTRIPHVSLAKDITNSVLLSFIKEDAQVANLQSWVATKIDQATESHISELWQYCYAYALMLLKNEDSAQEVCQTVMISFIQSHQPVMYVKAWLKGAVNNQAMLYLKMQKRDSALYATLINEYRAARQPVPASEAELESQLGDKKIKKLLSKEEYQIFAEMKQYPSVKSYALAKGINYSLARKSKQLILANLKASYLKQQGWADTPDILTHRQLANIKRFFDTLLERALSGDFTKTYRYADKAILPDLATCFADFKEVTDWGIHITPDGSFDVYIMDITNEAMPITISLELTMNKANYIKISSCRNLKLLGIIDEDVSGPLPLEKGRCTLTLDQIKAYF